MRTTEISEAIAKAIEGRRLLDHPFYQRWEKGELALSELTSYAEQYRLVEQILPEVLATVAASLPAGTSRTLVEENLSDELSNPAPHVELFESFASAVDARPAVNALPAMTNLVAQYRSGAAASSVAGLATLAAYEVQGAEIAISKADGLCRHYGVDAKGTQFWDVHGALEMDHAKWSIDALVAIDADPTEVFDAARASADAWWKFLDEREAAVAA